MNWHRGFAIAGLIFAASVGYAGFIVGMINWLGGWGLALSMVPIFIGIAASVAAEG